MLESEAELSNQNSRKAPGPALSCLWVVGLLAGTILVTWAISRHPAFLAFEMNADTLLAPAFVQDVLHHRYAWTGFQLARIPSLFPDLVLQALARLVSPSPAWGIFVYCAAQFAGLVFAAGWIVQLLTRASYLWATTCALLVLSLAVLAETLPPAPSGIPLMWFQSCAHCGPFVLCLCATALAARLLERWSLWRAALFFVLATATVLSDRLVLVDWVAPMAVAALAGSWLATRKLSRPSLGIVGSLIVAVIVATLLDRLIYRELDVPIVFAGAASRIARFLNQTPGFVAVHVGSILVGGVVPLLLFLAYPALVADREQTRTVQALGEDDARRPFFQDDPRLGFMWLTAALALAAITISTAALVFDGPAAYRYFSPVALWPLIFCSALLAQRPKARWAAGVLALAAGALLLGPAAAAKDARPGPVSWRSDVAECLTANQARYDLRQGFADYWTSRPVTLATEGRVQLEQMETDGRARVYGTDVFGLLKSYREAGSAPSFNYIVMRDLDAALVQARHGAPSQTFQCGPAGPSVWVYGDPAALTRTALATFEPPPGPYRRDCANALLVGGDLFAECRGLHGPRYSRLPAIALCDGDITARDGVLTAHCVRHFRRLSRMLRPPKRRP